IYYCSAWDRSLNTYVF
nr:immunoglobulin light chain junction region [Macaca mulatta]